jgi:hypothetical protein
MILTRPYLNDCYVTSVQLIFTTPEFLKACPSFGLSDLRHEVHKLAHNISHLLYLSNFVTLCSCA